MGERRPDAQASPGTGFRLRFALLVTLVAVVPLGLATWAVTRLVSNNELSRADTHLTAVVSVAQAKYAIQVSRLRLNATRKAADPYIQGLFVNDKRQAMRRFVQRFPLVAFHVRGAKIGGHYAEPVVVARVKVGSRTSENVLILARPVATFYKNVVPANRRTSKEHLVLLVGGAVVAGPVSGHVAAPSGNPGDVTIGKTTYRAVAIDLKPSTATGATITAVALRSRHSIDTASSGAWKWAIAAALVTLGTVALLAFLVAPAVAGRRWVRRLMPWELEEQYAVEVEPTDVAAPLTSHGAAPTGAGNGASPAAGTAIRRRIVVIDNDPDERTLFVNVLEPDGVEVATTGDAEQGLGLLGARPADLAILDWKMSGRSGAEILAEVNIRHPDVPVLVVADELEPQQRHVATLLGAEDFLIRPLESETVAAKTTRLLEASRSDRVPG
jgi:CheY-like chemotaxis protein